MGVGRLAGLGGVYFYFGQGVVDGFEVFESVAAVVHLHV